MDSLYAYVCILVASTVYYVVTVLAGPLLFHRRRGPGGAPRRCLCVRTKYRVVGRARLRMDVPCPAPFPFPRGCPPAVEEEGLRKSVRAGDGGARSPCRAGPGRAVDFPLPPFLPLPTRKRGQINSSSSSSRLPAAVAAAALIRAADCPPSTRLFQQVPKNTLFETSTMVIH